MSSRVSKASKLQISRNNLRAYKEILSAAEELRSVFESDDASGKRLWQLMNLIRADVDRILKASEELIQIQ
jgi:hypothetical protein